MAAPMPVLAWCAWIGAMLLCLIFVRGALHKLGDFDRFAADLSNYRMLPAVMSKPVAVLCLVLEIACLPLLCVASLRTFGAALALFLLLAYALAIAINLRRGRRSIDCGCGGGQGISWWHVLRNGVYALLCVPLLLGAASAPHGAAAMLAGGACVLALWLALLLFEQLLGNRMHVQATTHSRF